MAYTDEELNEMAVLAIFNYYSGEYTEEYIQNNFKLAIKVLANNISSSLNRVVGASTISENGISISYKDGNSERNVNLTDEVLALLPKKKKFYVW